MSHIVVYGKSCCINKLSQTNVSLVSALIKFQKIAFCFSVWLANTKNASLSKLINCYF